MPDAVTGNRVFISCVSDEFQKPAAAFPGLREKLRHYLTRADCEVKVQEDFRQTGDVDTVEKLDGYIRRCMAVIHLVGDMRGALANQKAVARYLAAEPKFLDAQPELRGALGDFSDLTYTQWEAFIALHHRVPLFVYARDEAASAQQIHLDRLVTENKYAAAFKSDADLLGQLIGDLRHIVPAFAKAVQRLAPPRFLHHAAEIFLGRDAELALLDAAWADGTNVVSLIAWGGVGKTALLSEWIRTRFIEKEWLDADGQPALLAYFDWSFYDQGTRALTDEQGPRTGSVGDFFAQALAFFGDPNPSAPGKGERLARLVRQERTLFILDGLEPLQYPVGNPQAGRLLDPDLRDFITSLAQSSPGLCVISSRQSVTDLDGLLGHAVRKKELEDLPRNVAVRLLRRLEIAGTDPELETACDRFGCHALSLTLLGRFLADAHQGDIRRIDHVKDLHAADTLTREERHRTAWKVLQAYDDWLATADAAGNPTTLAVLRLTGFFDRTATAGCLAALRAEPAIRGLTDAVVTMGPNEWNILLRRLERAHLIRVRTSADRPNQFGIDAHPLVREYFAEQLKRTSPAAFKAAHSRLFDYLCNNTPYRPDALVGLQPLYQAVVHGCLAGRHEEARKKVYIDRILRGTDYDGFYSWKKLGAIGADLGAVAAFFEVPWSRLSPNLGPPAQGWLLNEAATRLHTLGRLSEALEPMRVSVDMDKAANKWRSAAIRAGNMSELEVAAGWLSEAVADGRLAIDLADRSADWQQRMALRTTAADALHQAGLRAEGEALFAEAEQMQREHQPQYPMLYSIWGFRYTDFLLVLAERAAWRTAAQVGRLPSTTLEVAPSGVGSLATLTSETSEALAACAAVTRRATQTLEWSKMNAASSLLDIAFGQLTLVRATLYRTLMSGAALEALSQTVAAALSTLHHANALNHLPKALLTAALHAATQGGQPKGAKRYLDEAQLIAERGPMPLYLADVHLHRARLFGALQKRGEFEYPWESPQHDLQEARRLIEKHGYWRRKEELEDAEAAFGIEGDA